MPLQFSLQVFSHRLLFENFHEFNPKITLDILISHFRQAKVIYLPKLRETHHLKIQNNHLREHHQVKASNQVYLFLNHHLFINFNPQFFLSL
jgi:hypothetical protein